MVKMYVSEKTLVVFPSSPESSGSGPSAFGKLTLIDFEVVATN